MSRASMGLRLAQNLSGVMGGRRPALTQWLDGGVVGKKIVWIGDSTTMQLFTSPGWDAELRFHERPGEVLEGTTSVDFGENGSSTNAFLNGMVTRDIDAAVTEAADLYIIRYGINDVRQGGSSAAALRANLEAIVNRLRLDVPTADILLAIPNSLLAIDDGYISPDPETNAQVYTDQMWTAYNALKRRWPNVVLLDLQSLVFGRVSQTSSELMTDSLHPNAHGYFAITAAIAEVIGREANPYSQALADAAVSANYKEPWSVYPRACEHPSYFDLIAEGRWIGSATGAVQFDYPIAQASVIRNGDVLDMGGQVAALIVASQAAGDGGQSGTFVFMTPPTMEEVGRVRVWRHKYNGDQNLEAAVLAGDVASQIPCRLGGYNGLIDIQRRCNNSPVVTGVSEGDVLYVPGFEPLVLTGVSNPGNGAMHASMPGDWSIYMDKFGIVARPA